MIYLWGWHVFNSVLTNKKRKIYKIEVLEKFYKQVLEIVKHLNIEILIKDERSMSRSYGKNHQGIAFLTDQIRFWTLKDWIKSMKHEKSSVLLACDSIEDPQNLGAIIRTSKALGATGLLVTDRKCAPFNGALAKAAAGALELLPIVKVVNLSQSLIVLKEFDYRIYGLDHRGVSNYIKSDRSVLVLGQEGNGLRELTRKNCDDIISIHTVKDFSVLNVSVSAAIILYEFLKP